MDILKEGSCIVYIMSLETESLRLEDHSIKMTCEVSAIKISISKRRCVCFLEMYQPQGSYLDT